MNKLFLVLIAFCIALPCHAAKKYVNAKLFYYGTQAGTSADPYGGACGIQKAVNTATAGDTIYIKDTALTINKARVVHTTPASGNFIANDTLFNLNRVGSATVYLRSNDTVAICVTSGTFQLNDSIVKFDSSVRAKIIAAPTYPGVQITHAGSATTVTHIIGTKSDWTEDSSVYAVLDGRGLALVYDCVGEQYTLHKNLKIINSSGVGAARTAGTNQYQTWYNCAFIGNVSHGWNMPSQATAHNCTFSGNTSGGINGGSQGFIYNCVVRDNKGAGLNVGSIFSVINCAVFSNDSLGISGAGQNQYINCVIDSQKIGMVFTSNVVNTLVENCRITRNTMFPIKMASGAMITFGKNNVLLQNGNTNLPALAAGAVPIYLAPFISSGVLGYADSVNLKYNLRANAVARRNPQIIGCFK